MKQILVVDDDAQTRALVSMVLQRKGYGVTEAFDGPSALRLLDFLTPDLMIVDVMMPGIDGIELCRRIRARLQTERTPIIAFTASGSSRLDHSTREAGVNGFVTKTSPPQELVGLIQELLGSNGPNTLCSTVQ